MKTFYSNGKKLSEEITEYYKGSVSYSLANKLIRKKDVKINGVRVKTDLKTDVGDKVDGLEGCYCYDCIKEMVKEEIESMSIIDIVKQYD